MAHLAVVVADLNHDGIPDVVAATAGGTQVFLGRGDGTFKPPATISSTFSLSLAVADFNNDGTPDIATTILTNGDQVTLTLGKGAGTFQKPKLLPIGCIDCYLAAADFNGDGNMDLAVASASSVTVYLGHGDGTFSGGQPTYTAQSSIAAVAGDLNQDGKPDLVVTDFGAGTVIILLGNGDGSFERTDYPIGSTPFQTVLADFNGDGLPDLAVVDRNTDAVAVRMNQGGGIFGPAASYVAGCTPNRACTLEGLAAGDFNRDGKIDLATPGAFLEGNGDGTFQPPVPFYAGSFPTQVTAADLNGDGYADLIVENDSAENISVLLGSPRPWVELDVGVGSQPRDVAVGDFNGDGKTDLAVAEAGGNQVNILLGNGKFGFTAGAVLPVKQPGAIVARDLNGDGKADLAVSSDYGTWIYLANGDGTFRAATQYPSFYGDCTFNAIQTTASPCLAAADFNGDGIPDLVGALWIQDTVSFLLGNGDGTFRAGPQTLTVDDVPQGIAVADFNHDGKVDVAVSGYYGSVTVFPGNGDGTFGAGVKITATGSDTGAGLAVGDVNGDGHPDILLAGGSASSVISLGVFVITGNGDLTFNAPVALLTDEGPNAVVLADFNGDGRLDIASANLLGSDVAVLLNQGGMTFSAATLYGAAPGPVAIRSVDLNGDGKPDLVVVNQNSNN